jgi:hypothetical protein
MKRSASIGIALLVLSTAACGHKPDSAACERVMRADLQHALNGQSTLKTKPPECEGLSDAELKALVAKILVPSSTATP